MLKRKRQEKFLSGRCEKILNAISVFCLTGDPERMHQLRVEVKKINALVHLLEVCSGGPSRKALLKPMDKVYHKAALIRDAQVKLHLLAVEQVRNEELEKELKDIITDETKQFCAHADRHQQRVEKMHKELSRNLSAMQSQCVLDAYREWLDELSLFFSINFSADGLHNARKRIKDLMYIHAFLPASIKEQLQLNKTYLDELQSVIGQWRDSVLTIEILSARAFADQSIIIRLQEQSNKLLETIESLSADFIGKVRGLTPGPSPES